jgi:hypothetical protein
VSATQRSDLPDFRISVLASEPTCSVVLSAVLKEVLAQFEKSKISFLTKVECSLYAKPTENPSPTNLSLPSKKIIIRNFILIYALKTCLAVSTRNLNC